MISWVKQVVLLVWAGSAEALVTITVVVMVSTCSSPQEASSDSCTQYWQSSQRGSRHCWFLKNHIWIVFGTSATFYWPEPGTRRPGFESREQAEGTAKDLWLFFFF